MPSTGAFSSHICDFVNKPVSHLARDLATLRLWSNPLSFHVSRLKHPEIWNRNPLAVLHIVLWDSPSSILLEQWSPGGCTALQVLHEAFWPVSSLLQHQAIGLEPWGPDCNHPNSSSWVIAKTLKPLILCFFL